MMFESLVKSVMVYCGSVISAREEEESLKVVQMKHCRRI
jgi:hypothetical protein